MICVAFFIIFRPHIMGEENHDLCCVFLQVLPNLHDLHHLTIFIQFLDYFSYLLLIHESFRFMYFVSIRRKRRFEIIVLYQNF